MFDDAPDRYHAQSKAGGRFLVPAIAAAGIVAGGALAFVLLRPSGSPAPRPHQEPHITHIQLPPPPPPPPIKPPPEPPKKQLEKPKEQAPSPQKASVPKAAPKAPSPPAAVTTSITGPGPGSLAAGNGGGGDCIGSGCGTGDGGGGGPDDGYYTTLIRSRVQAAMAEDTQLRFARYDGLFEFRLDASGHLVTVRKKNFRGEPDIEQEVQRVLGSVTFDAASVKGMQSREFSIHLNAHA